MKMARDWPPVEPLVELQPRPELMRLVPCAMPADAMSNTAAGNQAPLLARSCHRVVQNRDLRSADHLHCRHAAPSRSASIELLNKSPMTN